MHRPTPRARMVRDMASENLLLWHSHRQKDQRGLRPDDENNALLNLIGRLDEPHWRCVDNNLQPGIFALQCSARGSRRTDQCYHQTLLGGADDDLGGRVAARGDRQA
jgi:hypothetical protein